jgi:hypothetical protein
MFDIRHRNRYLIKPLSLIPCSVYTFLSTIIYDLRFYPGKVRFLTPVGLLHFSYTFQLLDYTWLYGSKVLFIAESTLTLLFDPFRFWLRIRGDILIWKTTPRIVDTGSRYLKKISIASIFRTLSSRVGEYFVHVVGFYLNLTIFATWKSFQNGLINHRDSKAKWCNLKNWPVKGLCGRCLFVWGPPYTLYTYFILIHTGKGLRGGEELNQRED